MPTSNAAQAERRGRAQIEAALQEAAGRSIDFDAHKKGELKGYKPKPPSAFATHFGRRTSRR